MLFYKYSFIKICYFHLYILIFFSTTNCNALFSLINEIKGSITLNNILAQFWTLNTTSYHPRHTTMP